jgi:MFS family permease
LSRNYALLLLAALVAGPSHRTSQAGGARPHGFPVAVWVFAGYTLLTGKGMQATNVYLPLFAVRELHFSLVMGGIASGFSGLVGVTSRVLWGRRMALGARASSLLIVLGVGALLASAALLFAGRGGHALLLWCGVALYGASALGTNVVIMAGIMKVVPPGRVGAATGIVAMTMYAGFAAGPLLMGLVLENTGRFELGWIMVGAGYVLCVLLALYLRLHGDRTG